MIHDAELFTVAPDEVVVTFRTDDGVAVTTHVGGREVTTRGPFHVARVDGLTPATTYELGVDGVEPTDLLPASVTTLAEPPGRLLARFATVNDVHFGEVECGKLGTPEELGPVFSAAPGEEPYPEVMNRGAVNAMLDGAFDAVVVKGDLTAEGTDEEYDAFCRAYAAFGDRLHHVRGNHDAMHSHQIAAHGPLSVSLPGVTLAVLDTVRPGLERGQVTDDQLEWLDGLCAGTADAVLVFGHHHPWDPGSNERNDRYFGINPDDSERLCHVISGRDNVAGYFAGHTHRNRIRRFDVTGDVPIVEVACVKDYPGAWAEYRVYEGGYVQITRRVTAPDAMAWTEKTRQMFAGLYRDYALGALDERCFTHTF